MLGTAGALSHDDEHQHGMALENRLTVESKEIQ